MHLQKLRLGDVPLRRGARPLARLERMPSGRSLALATSRCAIGSYTQCVRDRSLAPATKADLWLSAQAICDGFNFVDPMIYGQPDGCCCNTMTQCASSNCDWATWRCAIAEDPCSATTDCTIARCKRRLPCLRTAPHLALWAFWAFRRRVARLRYREGSQGASGASGGARTLA